MFLYTLFIKPLELIFEVVYVLAYRVTPNYGVAIVCLSMVVNLLALPLYRQADMLQRAQREKEKSLEKWIAHIKRTFKGDERFMMLQTYNRQNSYGPLEPLRGTLPLLLEIPFFIAAYHFLSSLTFLKGVSFGLIPDLGLPDGLLAFGGISINMLPILMTVFNLLSGLTYAKGTTSKYLRQLILIAGIFLVLLYNSPAALTLYWLLNNVFSLLKNIILNRKQNERSEKPDVCNSDLKTVIMSGILASVFIGFYVPSKAIGASPEEFMDISYIINPLKTLLFSFALASGFFIIWPVLLYQLSNGKIKRYFPAISVFFSVASIINLMCFDAYFGNISTKMGFFWKPLFTLGEKTFNLFIMICLFALCLFIYKKSRRLINYICITTLIVFTVMSMINANEINFGYKHIKSKPAKASGYPEITFNSEGKNVVVIMMDALIGRFIPYIMNEKPELYEKFSGFTFYPNSVSFGGHTNLGTPGLYGGYDYIPTEMNKRDKELLKDKQNEALKVLPVLFNNNDYDVTVCDPTYANYQMVPDLSIYDDYPDIKRYITNGIVGADIEGVKKDEKELRRTLFMYSLFKTLPSAFRETVYDSGHYWSVQTCRADYIDDVKGQKREELSRSAGYDRTFLKAYRALAGLSDITHVDKKKGNTFLMMSNDTSHENTLLQEPEYMPAEIVDNTEYDREHPGRYAPDGTYMAIDTRNCAIRYQVCMASILKLGDWMDYLKENGVYDNTRIIIVSDHAYSIWNTPELEIFKTDDSKTDLTQFNCTLLVKDFGSREYITDMTFMTNADVPSLAVKDLIDHPVNPFTGNSLEYQEEKKAEVIIHNSLFDVSKNNGYKFMTGDWFSVKENIFDINNWKYLGEY